MLFADRRVRASHPRGPRAKVRFVPLLHPCAKFRGKKMAESARTPPFLLEHSRFEDQGSPQQPHRSVHPLDLGRARGVACAHPSTALRPVRGMD
jgi:hypothetical protein